MLARAPSVPLADQPGGPWAHLRSFRETPLEVWTRAQRQHEPVLKFRLGPMSALGVFDPDLVEQVLVQQPEVFDKNTRGQHLLRVLLGESMLTTEGDVWRARRRLAQPHFKRNALERYQPVLVRAARGLADRLAARDGQEVDVADEMMALTLAVACEALFGGELGQASEDVHHALTEVLDAYMWMVTVPLPSPEHLPLPASLRFHRARRALFDVVDRVIARRRAEPAGDDLLSEWLGAGLDDAALRSEVVTMLLAAHETTANLLTWTLALLSRHPLARRALVDELAARDRDAELDLRATPQLSGVLMESMRLIPPVWLLSRATTAPVRLGDYDLAPNTFVFICSWALHRDPRLWDNPEGFDPGRWTKRPAHKMAYLPFGAGQRRCIGEHFALMEAGTVLAELLPRVRLDLVPGQSLVPKPSVTLRPDGPMRMTAHVVH